MKFGYSENAVHAHMYASGIDALIVESKDLEEALAVGTGPISIDDADFESSQFELWRIIKLRALKRIERIHRSIKHGKFIGSKIKLPIDGTRAMELDLLGQHDDGIFILELKVDDSSERNAFSELLGYSQYIAQMFAMSGPGDITNVLVAPMHVKITRQAFLYDLLVANRDVVVYKPVLVDGTLASLQLQLYVPPDEEFRFFANQLLSHDAMSCTVVSFPDLKGWYDSTDVYVNEHTRKFLSGLSGYASQLMEAEQLHGFSYIRQYWPELPFPYKNALIICAINPFVFVNEDRAEALVRQLDEESSLSLLEQPRHAFLGRVIRLAERAIRDSLSHGQRYEIGVPQWSAMVRSIVETATCTNFGFRPTGLFREAFVTYINRLHQERSDGAPHDVSRVKIEDVSSWMRAWIFMEVCGFDGTNSSDIEDDLDDDPEES